MSIRPAGPFCGGVARWAPPLTLLLSVTGLGVSAYLTVEHFRAGSRLACPATGLVDCAGVTQSSYATPFGVPVALLGVVFFTVLTLLCTPPAWRQPRLDVPRRLVTLAGALVVLWLVYVELFLLDRICLWCTATHVLALSLFAVNCLVHRGSSGVSRP